MKDFEVDFGLLVQLIDEAEENGHIMSIQEAIAVLEMNEIRMSPLVRRLGVIGGVLIK